MLVLKLQYQQKIVIDDGRIVIQVVETGRHHCKLGFDAPKEITINRQEIQNRIDAARNSSREGATE